MQNVIFIMSYNFFNVTFIIFVRTKFSPFLSLSQLIQFSVPIKLELAIFRDVIVWKRLLFQFFFGEE